MSSEDARLSQSAISFNVLKKQGETSTQRSTKRLREDTEHLTPETLISNSSTSTIIQEEDNINSNLLTAAPPLNHNTDGFAIKLNDLTEKLQDTTNTDIFSQNIYRKALSQRD